MTNSSFFFSDPTTRTLMHPRLRRNIEVQDFTSDHKIFTNLSSDLRRFLETAGHPTQDVYFQSELIKPAHDLCIWQDQPGECPSATLILDVIADICQNADDGQDKRRIFFCNILDGEDRILEFKIHNGQRILADYEVRQEDNPGTWPAGTVVVTAKQPPVI